jgi:hypothetical protein
LPTKSEGRRHIAVRECEVGDAAKELIHLPL